MKKDLSVVAEFEKQHPLPKAKRGFAAMNTALHKSIASSGGKRSWQLGKAHQWTSEEARQAGKKGRRKRNI